MTDELEPTAIEADEPQEEPKAASKRKSSKRSGVVDETPIMAKLEAAIGDLRQQLRGGGVVVLPGLLQQLMPLNAGTGDRAKVIDWRSFVVYGEWTGLDWDIIVYDGGQERTQ